MDSHETIIRANKRRYKVFNGYGFIGGRQYHMIVAATSQKRAAELVRVSLACFRDYWSETGNDIQLEVALSAPETVFYSDIDDYSNHKSKWKKRL